MYQFLLPAEVRSWMLVVVVAAAAALRLMLLLRRVCLGVAFHGVLQAVAVVDSPEDHWDEMEPVLLSVAGSSDFLQAAETS